MEKQSFRCASCGTRVDQKYASKFRYCEYLGRYFCTGCHSGQTTIIPGRVLSKWDFSKYVHFGVWYSIQISLVNSVSI